MRSCSGRHVRLFDAVEEQADRARLAGNASAQHDAAAQLHAVVFLGGRRIDQHRPLGDAADLAVQHFAVDHRHVRQAGFQQVTAAQAGGLAAVLDPQFDVEMVALLNARPQEAADDAPANNCRVASS